MSGSFTAQQNYHTDLFLIHTLTLSFLFQEDEWDENKDLEPV